MQLIISIFLAIMPAHAQPDTGAEACDDWGTIDQDGTIFEIIRAGSGQRTFSVLAPTCGDAEQCTWTLNGGNEIQKPGTLYKCGEEPGAEPITEFVGDEVCYLPPASLYQCRSFEFQIKLECGASDDGLEPPADFVEGVAVPVEDGEVRYEIELEDLSLECTVDATVTGGGCISAQGSGVVTASAWLLFPFFGVGAWMRRRDD